MNDEVGAELVDPQAQPVAAEAQTSVATELERFQRKVQIEAEHRKTAERKLKEAEARAAQLEAKAQELEAERVRGSGDHSALADYLQEQWDAAKQTNAALQARITELEAQVEGERQATAAEKLRFTALARISDAGAVSPEQTYLLLERQIKEAGGEPVALVGGVEVPLAKHLEALRQPGSGYEHHFRPTMARGMGTTAGAPAAPAGMLDQNPYDPRNPNITAQWMLEDQNPELAASLRAQAGVTP